MTIRRRIVSAIRERYYSGPLISEERNGVTDADTYRAMSRAYREAVAEYAALERRYLDERRLRQKWESKHGHLRRLLSDLVVGVRDPHTADRIRAALNADSDRRVA